MRGIFESEGFARAKLQIHSDPEAVDEVLDAILWAIARNPQVGLLVDHQSTLRALPTREWLPHGVPPMVIYYFFDDHNVNLVGLLLEERSR